MSHYDALARMIDSLHDDTRIVVERAEIERGPESIDELVAASGLTFAPEVLRFHREIGSLRLEWSLADPSVEPVWGCIDIHGFDRAFALPPHEHLWGDLLGIDYFDDEDARAGMRDFHALDYVRTDDQDAVGWLAEGTHVNDVLAQYWMRHRGHGPAVWTIDAYVRELLLTRGALHEGERAPMSAWSAEALDWLRTFFREP